MNRKLNGDLGNFGGALTLKRRRLFGIALATMSSTAIMPLASAATSSKVMSMPSMREAIGSCLACHTLCLKMATVHCPDLGGKHVIKGHLGMLINCAELCKTSADFMISESPLHSRVCLICAEVCEACAKSCIQVGQMQDCVDECLRCAKSCRAMT